MSGTGTQFTARVVVNTETLPNFVAGDFSLVYDYNVLNISDVMDGLFAGHTISMGALDWSLIGSGPGGQGKLRAIPDLTGDVGGDGNGFTGSGYFCDILFETTGTGTTTLDFVPTLYSEAWYWWSPYELMWVTWINGSVTVSGP